MRTLQEKYNGIQEGKFSKDQFLVEARQQLPNLVTRYNGYNDAVQILKNRGMIVEVSTEESFKDYSNDALTDMIINLSRYENNEDSIARVKAELARRKQAVNEGLGDKQYLDALRNSNANSIESAKKVLKRKFKDLDDKNIDHLAKEWAKRSLDEAKLTKKSLTDYRYKPTNEMDKYPYEQILRGLRVELETMGVKDVPTAEEYTKALSKVSKNLEKDSIFYTNQVAGVNPKVDLHDKLIPINQKELFKTSVATPSKADGNKDTFNDLKKAQLKEGFKKLIKKVLTEGMESIGDQENWKTDKEDPLHDYMESIQPKEEEEVENYKKAEEEQLDESPTKNNPKIEKLVNGINDLIAKAVDIDGDPIGIVDTQSTWQEPEVYSPIEYRNGALKITSKSPYKSEVNTEVISSKRMGDDGIETLRYLMRKYKQAAKKAGTNLYPEKEEDLDENYGMDNNSRPGLLVTGRTRMDNNSIGDVLDDLGLYGEWDVRAGSWFLPEDESTYDDLEEMLEQEFATRGINARFEGIFNSEDEADDISHPRGYEEASDAETEDDLYEGKQSLMELLGEASSKHSTEWHKGYKAFNEYKELKDNPYKENPKKEDWTAGWKQANSDEKSSK